MSILSKENLAWIAICILLQHTSFSQNQDIVSSQVRGYYTLINDAELYIVDGQYNQAQKIYHDAFELKQPNDKDLMNAFSVAFYLHDTAKTLKYINLLASHGWSGYNSYNYIKERCPNVDLPFLRSINTQCDSIFQLAKQSNLPKNANRWAILFNEDQKVRRRLEEVGHHDSCVLSAMKATDSLNLILAQQYILDGHFPSFEQVGYFINGSEIMLNNANTLFYILFWHQRGFKNASPLDSLALEAVYRGDFRPDLWAACIRFRQGMAEKLGLDKHSIDSYTLSEIAEIDENRKKYLLEPLSDYFKKLDYYMSKSNPKIGFGVRFFDIFLQD